MEACEVAETEPRLIDAVTVLDFPELPQWVPLLVAQQEVPSSIIDRRGRGTQRGLCPL